MKVDNINDFKKRLKLLYEYRVHDLSMNNNVMEDEQQPQSQQPAPPPAPVVAKPEQPATPVVQQPEKVEQDEDMVLSYLKGEMQKLENVVSKIDTISLNVDNVSKRLDIITNNMTELSKAVEEVKEPTDIEKLEMRALDSYPYNNTISRVWDDKMKSKEDYEMERMGVRKTENGYEMDYIPEPVNPLNITKSF